MTKITIHKFKNLQTGKEQYEIMGINNTFNVFDGREWEIIESFKIPNLEDFKKTDIK